MRTALRFHGDKRETLGWSTSLDFREQTRSHTYLCNRDQSNSFVKLSTKVGSTCSCVSECVGVIGARQRGKTDGQRGGCKGRCPCQLDVHVGIVGMLHFTDGEGACLLCSCRNSLLHILLSPFLPWWELHHLLELMQPLNYNSLLFINRHLQENSFLWGKLPRQMQHWED